MRLFIGIAPDERTRVALALSAGRLQQDIAGHYAAQANYHLTLAFLGEQPDRALLPIEQAMIAAAMQVRPFLLHLAGIATFGPVLYRDVRHSDTLVHLAETLRSSLAAYGVAYETLPFVPHFTLARHVLLPDDYHAPALPDATCPVNAIHLYESKQTEVGHQYTARRKVSLS